MEQSFLIEEMSENDPEIAGHWDDAKKGKRSVSSVYNMAVRKKEALENKGSEVEPKEEVAKDTRPILAQVNDKLRAEIKEVKSEAKEWRERYHGLKAGYELLESKYETLKNNLQMVLEGKADFKIVDADIGKKAHPTPKELRKAELM
jgi:chromosome segregation ATPase